MKKNDFILGYEIDDDRIEVRKSSGDYHHVPYTKENEKELLNRMEEQLYEFKTDSFTHKALLYGGAVSTLVWSVGFANHINAAVAEIGNLPYEANMIVGTLFLGLTVIGGTVTGLSIKKELDIRKCRKFLNDKKLVKVDFKNYDNKLSREETRKNNVVNVPVQYFSLLNSNKTYRQIEDTYIKTVQKPKTLKREFKKR